MKPLLLVLPMFLLLATPRAGAWNLFETVKPKNAEAAGITLKHSEQRIKPHKRTYVRHQFDFTFDTATLPEKDYVDITIRIRKEGGESEVNSTTCIFASNRDSKERYIHLSFEIEESYLAKSEINIQRILKPTKDPSATAASILVDTTDTYEEGGYWVDLGDYVKNIPTAHQ